MKVLTLVNHYNPFGDKFEKSPDDVYHLPDAEAAALIEQGLVEEHAEEDAIWTEPGSDSEG